MHLATGYVGIYRVLGKLHLGYWEAPRVSDQVPGPLLSFLLVNCTRYLLYLLHSHDGWSDIEPKTFWYKKHAGARTVTRCVAGHTVQHAR